MLSAARKVFAAGATSPKSTGDPSLFLSAEDAAMRWFLLPSDCEATAASCVTPPFKPRVYPHTQATPTGEAVVTEGEAREHPVAAAAPDTIKPDVGSSRVQFHSPPKSIFRPVVEVSTCLL